MNSKDGSDHKPAPPSNPANDENSLFKTCFSNFQNAPKYSDLTISCGGRTWHAHRVIVCSQSDFFERACSGGFMESESQHITLEDEPHVVDLIMMFFYTRDFFVEWKIDSDPTGLSQDESDTLDTTGPPVTPLTTIAMVYILADKYAIHGLKELAVSKTEQQLFRQRGWWKDFAQAAKIIWTSTPASQQGIRNPFLEKFLLNREDIFRRGAIAIEDLWAMGEFLHDVLKADWELQTTGKSAALDLARFCGKCTAVGEPRCTCRSSDAVVGPTRYKSRLL